MHRVCLGAPWHLPAAAALYRNRVTHPDESPREPDDDDLFLAVGRAVAAGATLEWEIVELHGALLHSPRSDIAVAGQGVDRARTGCMDMASLIGDPVDSLVRAAVAPVSELWQQRNALVHGAWLAGSHLGEPGRSGITIRMGRRGLSTHGWSVRSITTLSESLGDAALGISSLRQQLNDDAVLMRKLDKRPPPWPLGPPRVW